MLTTRKYLLVAIGLLLVTVALRPVRRAYSHRFGQAAADRKLFHDGDLVFHTSRSEQSQAIQLATHSPWSHCGLLYQDKGQWWVLEAMQPVKVTPLMEWTGRGRGDHYVVKRLRDAATALTPAALQEMKTVGKGMVGRDYDGTFGWSDDRIYCSELIYKVYERSLHRRLGTLQKLGDFDLSHPAVQAKLKERYGDKLPLNEPVISPGSIFNSPELVTVLSR
ncbi:YiiX family permuted papain-like enzyme [Hymenobacter properus]|uniref:YiiX family permuted papain-like enzyme n=1 Tax=Hymenobacter properus TaxID=2791026 RepID=A0A931BA81_9BACT|nr:YiiX family permuted papain-like enzyme [Hymenobacter properus]MBF9140150.1 YiiX family permuted papain-like enzyme [Hymenobacter properus]MBR7718957.1 YiiX family permuted papain-like enzyme [Microvirga sp. SRT04]